VETKPKDFKGRSKSLRKPVKEVKQIEEVKASEEPLRKPRNTKAATEEKQNLKKEDKQKVIESAHIYDILLILNKAIV
jgi:hypothetical protein